MTSADRDDRVYTSNGLLVYWIRILSRYSTRRMVYTYSQNVDSDARDADGSVGAPT